MAFQLNKNQNEAVKHTGSPLLIIAGAGTGKTAVITQRIVHLINSGKALSSEILALTFTEKAATEMTERVDMEMPIGYESVDISTFHAFADRVLRQDGLHIGLDTQFNLMTQAQSYVLFRQNLFNLSLDRFRPLGNPTSSISDILKHFSRLQDEDITPDQYIKFADDFVATDEESDDLKLQYLELSKVYAEYTKLKFESSSLDFGDLIITTLKLLRERPSVLQKYHHQYKYILVDEYQDTNYTQNALVNLLTLGGEGDSVDKSKRETAELTVVGDDDQSIYKFRGAAISNILQFKQTYPAARSIVLNENYRSNQEVLDTAYALIQHNNPDRLEVTEGINKRLVASGDKSPQADSPDKVSWLKATHSSEESDLIAKEILALTGDIDQLKADSAIVDGRFDDAGQAMFVDVRSKTPKKYNYSDIAILTRANSYADEIMQSLRHYGIPFKQTGPKGLYTRTEVRNLISYLRVLTNFTDDIHMFNILNMDIWGLSPREISDLMQAAKFQHLSLFHMLESLWGVVLDGDPSLIPTEQDLKPPVTSIFSAESASRITKLLHCFSEGLRQIHAGESVGEILYEYFKSSSYLDSLVSSGEYEDQFKLQNISKYFELIKRYESSSPDSTLISYVDYLNYSIEIGENPKTEEQMMEDYDAVSIMTVHSSKGLEYPVVFMASLAAQRFPIKNMSDRIPIPEGLVKEILTKKNARQEHLQEERRLAYVAVTRAKELLYLTSSEIYGDGKQRRKPSQFISEMLGEKLDAPKQAKGTAAQPRFEVSISQHSEKIEIHDRKLDKVDRVSYSHVSTYEKCPKQYRYRYLLKLPGQPSATLSFGRTVHNTLLQFYKQRQESEIGFKKPEKSDLLEMYEDKWISSGYESKKHEAIRKEYGLRKLESFYDNQMDQGEVPILLEKKFTYKIGDAVLSGVIDRVDLVGEEDGVKIVDIIDYKTGNLKDKKKAAKDLQLAIYTLVAEEMFGYKVRSARLLYIEHNEKLEADISEKLKQEALNKVIDTVEQIRAGKFSATPGFHCSFCDYRDICEDAM